MPSPRLDSPVQTFMIPARANRAEFTRRSGNGQMQGGRTSGRHGAVRGRGDPGRTVRHAPKGTTLDAGHVKSLLAWDLTEVAVRDPHGPAEPQAPRDMDPVLAEEAEAEVARRFASVDTDQAVGRLLYRLALDRASARAARHADTTAGAVVEAPADTETAAFSRRAAGLARGVAA